MLFSHTCPQELGADKLYCGICGVPIQLPCPYDSSHIVPVGISSGGRCPICEKVVRYCPKCGSIFTIRDISCTGCEIALKDFFVSYDHFRGGITASSGTEMPNYSFSTSREDDRVVTSSFKRKICAPISSWNSLFFFVDDNQAVWKLDESLAKDPVCSKGLGSKAPPDLKHTNLSAGRGMIGVLLQDRAVLLDAVGLSEIGSFPGSFSSQIFTSETYYLFGSDETPEGYTAKAVDLVTGRYIADFKLEIADMMHPVSDGQHVYVLARSGKLVKIMRSDSGIKQVSRMFCNGENLGQPILLGAHIYAIASKRQLIGMDVPGMEYISTKILDTELTTNDIFGIDGVLVVQEHDQVVYLDSEGRSFRKDMLPARHSVKDAFVAKLGQDIVAILHLSNADPKYDSFRCWDVVSGSPRNTLLRTVLQQDIPGFIVSNGAVLIFIRSKGDVIRYVIGNCT